MTASYALHPWTTQGLGGTPFTLTQVIDLGSRKGTCDACGQTHLRWKFTVKEVGGRLFDVGSSCIQKVDAGLHREAAKAKRLVKKVASKRWLTKEEMLAKQALTNGAVMTPRSREVVTLPDGSQVLKNSYSHKKALGLA